MHVQVKLYKDTQDFLERRPLATKPTTLMKKAIEVYNKSK